MRNIIIILLTILSLSSFSQSNDSIDVSDTTIYAKVDSIPQFPGGNAKLFEYLGKTLKHPPYQKFGWGILVEEFTLNL